MKTYQKNATRPFKQANAFFAVQQTPTKRFCTHLLDLNGEGGQPQTPHVHKRACMPSKVSKDSFFTKQVLNWNQLHAASMITYAVFLHIFSVLLVKLFWIPLEGTTSRIPYFLTSNSCKILQDYFLLKMSTSFISNQMKKSLRQNRVSKLFLTTYPDGYSDENLKVNSSINDDSVCVCVSVCECVCVNTGIRDEWDWQEKLEKG